MKKILGLSNTLSRTITTMTWRFHCGRANPPTEGKIARPAVNLEGLDIGRSHGLENRYPKGSRGSTSLLSATNDQFKEMKLIGEVA